MHVRMLTRELAVAARSALGGRTSSPHPDLHNLPIPTVGGDRGSARMWGHAQHATAFDYEPRCAGSGASPSLEHHPEPVALDHEPGYPSTFV
jgi:hypothetical protein